jgi:hypothetical protein
VHVRRLREKIERRPSRPSLLQTIRGIGYRIRPPAAPRPPGAPAPPARRGGRRSRAAAPRPGPGPPPARRSARSWPGTPRDRSTGSPASRPARAPARAARGTGR